MCKYYLMMSKKTIGENELDQLLREMYLEKNSKQENEKEAQFVLSQDYNVRIDPKKEQDLIDKLQQKPSPGNSDFFSVACIIIAIGISLGMYFMPKEGVLVSNGKTLINGETAHIKNQSIENPVKETASQDMLAKETTKIPDTFGRMKIIPSPNVINQVPEKEEAAKANNKMTVSVPYLAEKDKTFYLNVKRQMIFSIIKPDKNLYTHIEANKSLYKGKSVVIEAFTLRNVGVSNLEYKVFLADLLIQKRNEDYLAAQVFSDNWLTSNCPTLAGTYFEDEKYNDFPVVNISYEGAKLFCKWLEEEIQTYIKQNNLKAKPLKIRLPYDEEWIYAAHEGYAKIAFEKGYNTIYDVREGLTDPSFISRIETIKRRIKRIDTLYSLYTTNRYGWSEKEITDFLSDGTKNLSILPWDTIDGNRMKVFGKVGRVSEIVPQRNTSQIWLSGLSWKSKEEYLNLQNEFKMNSSSPFVGFRFVIINENDPVYKNPFW